MLTAKELKEFLQRSLVEYKNDLEEDGLLETEEGPLRFILTEVNGGCFSDGDYSVSYVKIDHEKEQVILVRGRKLELGNRSLTTVEELLDAINECPDTFKVIVDDDPEFFNNWAVEESYHYYNSTCGYTADYL